MGQHANQGVHKKASASTSNQVSIRGAFSKLIDVQTVRTRATFYHVVKLVLDNGSFRSSDCFSRKRSLYTTMFPEAHGTDIACGRTKAMYIAVHGIAPFVREEIVQKLERKLFALHVDESTYNKKVRLEYWIVYLSGCNREVQYLCTRELKVEFDVSSFVSSANATLSLGSLKLVDADAVYRTTLSVLSDFRLDNQNLIYLMTDNCPVMRGSQKGLVSQMKDHCPNMLDIDGCGCHKMNLVQKDATQSDKVAEIITFAEHLSNFLENEPKVQSILQQCQQMLGLTRINGHCPTRFLSLFNVLNSAYEQFNLLKKIICISNDFELKASLTSTKFLIHLDQFLIHTEPIYIFTKQTQSPDITLYECLSEMLRLISKLLTRLGHCISLTPEDYHHKLYRRDAPICFQRGKTEFSINGNNQDVQDAADSLSQSEINSIKSCWDKHNEEQLYRLLKRFKNFLTSQIVRRCHIIKSADHDETFLESFKQLCGATQINKVKAVDELSSIRVEHKSDTLEQMFADGRLGGSPHDLGGLHH